MRRFRFGLKRLERLRDLKRMQARAQLAQVLGRVRDIVRDREARERVLADSLSVDPPESGPLDAAAWRERAGFHDGLRRGIRQVAVAERKERARAEQATIQLAETSREHRVLERLRERQHARWLRDAELEERKFLDEIHRASRRQEAGGEDA